MDADENFVSLRGVDRGGMSGYAGGSGDGGKTVGKMFCWDMVRLRVDSAFICEEESEDVSGVRVNNGWFLCAWVYSATGDEQVMPVLRLWTMSSETESHGYSAST